MTRKDTAVQKMKRLVIRGKRKSYLKKVQGKSREWPTLIRTPISGHWGNGGGARKMSYSLHGVPESPEDGQ